MFRSLPILLVLGAAAALPAVAAAQSEGPVGVRATGMGGAFVAVADDGSATFWNPAGLASGSYFSLVVDWSSLLTPDASTAPHGRSAVLAAMGTPPLGVSYYRTRVSRTQPLAATAGEAPGRNTAGRDLRLETLVTHQAGVTLVQSVWRSVAVGATVKYVRGVAATSIVSSGSPAIRSTGDLPGTSSGTVDVDFGVMAAGSVAKIGLAVRNARQPSFASTAGADPITLQRRVRGGVSFLLTPSLTVAADADFTKAETSAGRWRDAAVGAEARLSPRAWARGGVHWNTAGGASGPGSAPILSVGGSYTVYGSVLADAQVSVGSEAGDRGWGLGVRFVF